MRFLVAAMRVVSESHGICVNGCHTRIHFLSGEKTFLFGNEKLSNPLLISLVLS